MISQKGQDNNSTFKTLLLYSMTKFFQSICNWVMAQIGYATERLKSSAKITHLELAT